MSDQLRLGRRVLAVAVLVTVLPSAQAIRASLIATGTTSWAAIFLIALTVLAAFIWVLSPDDVLAGFGVVALPYVLRHQGAIVTDGGDAAAAVLALWLAPQPLLHKWDDRGHARAGVAARFLEKGARWQVHVIYASAFLAKLRTTDWRSGHAFADYASDPFYGATTPLQGLVHWLHQHFVANAAATYAILVLEGALAICWLFSPRLKRVVICCGVLMHVGIAMVLGLGTFAIVMLAALTCIWPSQRLVQSRRPASIVPAQVASGYTKQEVTP